MATENKLYCRLCAEIKPDSKLLDLTTDCIKQKEVIDKLTKINVTFIDLSLIDCLPKAICFICNDALDQALTFISQIQESQNVLKQIFIDGIVKDETDCNYNNEVIDAVKREKDIKLEFDSDHYDAEPDYEPKVEVLPKTKRKRKSGVTFLQDVLDVLEDNDIPLSKLKCRTWKDFPWLCYYCNSQFFTVDELKNHSMENHDSCTPYKCLDCHNNTCKSLNRFIAHVQRHKKHLKLCCHVCNKEFPTNDDLNVHKLEHINSNSLNCKGCNTNFENYTQLADHSIKFYKKRFRSLKPLAQPLSCEVCSKVFVSRSNLTKHRQIHTERLREHVCEKCGKRFYDKGTLTSHMQLHENMRKYKCEICMSGFRTASQLRSHIGIHGGPKPHACDQCGRTFRLRTQLKSHLIIHTDSLPYQCEFCTKAFRFKTILTQHTRQHTGVKPYSCEHCLREFTNWPNYNKHMKRRHSMDMAKKKHTPLGVFPINPSTGEILSLPDCISTDEWKKKVMVPGQRGRPRVLKPEMITDNK